VDAAVDSSTLISLAWSGQLELLDRVPLRVVIPAAVRRETVEEGLEWGYPDAAAIERAIAALPVTEGAVAVTVDAAVLEAGRAQGVLLTNDVALGRRAANLGVHWLRTADLVMLCVRSGSIGPERGIAAVRALRSAGRLTEDLLHAYLEELT
jgi:predicted nucleic acid-binding protein